MEPTPRAQTLAERHIQLNQLGLFASPHRLPFQPLEAYYSFISELNKKIIEMKVIEEHQITLEVVLLYTSLESFYQYFASLPRNSYLEWSTQSIPFDFPGLRLVYVNLYSSERYTTDYRRNLRWWCASWNDMGRANALMSDLEYCALQKCFNKETFQFEAICCRFLDLTDVSSQDSVAREINLFLSTLANDVQPYHLLVISWNPSIRTEVNLSEVCFQVVHQFEHKERNTAHISDSTNGRQYYCIRNKRRKAIDLHGATKQQAKVASINFFWQSHEEFTEGSIVITGRGNHANTDGSRGVIKHSFPKWAAAEDVSRLGLKAKICKKNPGAYNVSMRVFELDLAGFDREECIRGILKYLGEMLQLQCDRLLIRNVPDIFGAKPEEKLFYALVRELHEDVPLVEAIAPIRYIAIPGAIQIFLRVPDQEHSLFSFSTGVSGMSMNFSLNGR